MVVDPDVRPVEAGPRRALQLAHQRQVGDRNLRAGVNDCRDRDPVKLHAGQDQPPFARSGANYDRVPFKPPNVINAAWRDPHFPRLEIEHHALGAKRIDPEDTCRADVFRLESRGVAHRQRSIADTKLVDVDRRDGLAAEHAMDARRNSAGQLELVC
ncbi:MAG: hypothetical protein M3Q15_03365 [Pseudomonadota bacterium]|nr:hypothetical protein [Pseudomonadota bacterium]